MPIGTVAAVVGATAAVGNTIGNLTSSGAQASGDNTAAQTQLAMYNQTRSDLLPYNQGGQQAFGNLTNLLGLGGPQASQNMLAGLQNYPGYQFALQQGGQAVDRSAAARGLLLSGGQLKDLTNYGQGQASQLFQQYFNNNNSLAQLGESAAAQTGNAGTAAAANAGQAQMAAGTANASGIAGAANSLFGNNGLLQNALSAYNSQTYAPLSPGYTSGVNVTPGVGNIGGYAAGSGFDGSEPY